MNLRQYRELLALVVGLACGYMVGVTMNTSTTKSLPRTILDLTGRDRAVVEKLPVAKVLHAVLKMLSTAHRHARSGIAILEISKSFQEVHRLMREITGLLLSETHLEGNGQISPLFSDDTENRDVCPEVWMGMQYGWPYYENGHELVNCSYGKKMKDILTIVIDFTENPSDVERVAMMLHREYGEINIIAVVPAEFSTHTSSLSRIIRTGKTAGNGYNKAISAVTTKYTLIARGLHYFDGSSRLERLVRMVNYLGVDMAAGSHRNLSGHWKIDCFQMKMLNYGFRIVEGYDLAYNSCMYCDYTAGPFVAKTEFLRNNQLPQSALEGELMWLDYAYSLKKLGKTIMSCPDVTFFTQGLSQFDQISRKNWQRFAKQYELNSIHLPNRKLEFNCEDIEHTCKRFPPKGTSNMPCCLNIFWDMIRYIFSVAEKYNIQIELEHGTVLGAVKFGGIIPWEIDADMSYLSLPTAHGTFNKLARQFKNDGYRIMEEKTATNCPSINDSSRIGCGYFTYWKFPYRLELYGTVRSPTDVLLQLGLNSTKGLINGDWFRTKPNPAKYARNLYGDDIFEHVEHWRAQANYGPWTNYHTGLWLQCHDSGKHSCLNNFLPVGNIQFQEIWI